MTRNFWNGVKFHVYNQIFELALVDNFDSINRDYFLSLHLICISYRCIHASCELASHEMLKN